VLEVPHRRLELRWTRGEKDQVRLLRIADERPAGKNGIDLAPCRRRSRDGRRRDTRRAERHQEPSTSPSGHRALLARAIGEMFSMIDRRWALVNGVGVWATASSVGRVTCR
jgi:hypothetical protein